MIKNLASYRIGDRLIISLSGSTSLIEVRILEKAPRMIKIKALDKQWWELGKELWLDAHEIKVQKKLKS